MHNAQCTIFFEVTANSSLYTLHFSLFFVSLQHGTAFTLLLEAQDVAHSRNGNH